MIEIVSTKTLRAREPDHRDSRNRRSGRHRDDRRVLGPRAGDLVLHGVEHADDPADSEVIARRLGDTTRFGSGASQMTELRDDLVRRGLLSNADGTHLAFVHPAARSFVLSWD